MTDPHPSAPPSPKFTPVPDDLVPRTETPVRVLVLGAGMAGLAAGYQLARAGYDVTILEARDRPGGRVQTIREPFEGGQHVEAGAMFLPGQHALTIGYAARFGLELAPIGPDDLPTMMYVRGTPIVDPNAANAAWPVPLWDRERIHGVAGQFMDYIIGAVAEIGDPRAPGWPTPAALKYDTMSMAEFLQAQGASPGAIELLRLGYLDLWGDGIESYSALLILRDMAGLMNAVPPHTGHKHPKLRKAPGPSGPDPRTWNWQVAQGNDRLPAAIAADPALASRVHYGEAVARLERGADGPVRCRTATGRLFEADAVICTIPFSVLRSLELAVPLSREKLRAIGRLEYTSFTRVYVQTATRVWKKLGRPGIANTDLPVRWVNDQTAAQTGAMGILESGSAGPQARAFAALGDVERARQVVAGLDRVYPGVANEVVCSTSKCWDLDPWARGDYCWFLPGDMRALLPSIVSAEAGIHFAGDHTSPSPGWIQGAIESGHRAALEIAATRS